MQFVESTERIFSSIPDISIQRIGVSRAWMSDLDPKWVKLAPNGKYRGLFKMRLIPFRSNLTHFLHSSDFPEPDALKSDLKKPWICPILGPSDTLWSQTYHPCCKDWRVFEKSEELSQVGITSRLG